MDKATLAIVLNVITMTLVVYILVCKTRTKESFTSAKAATSDLPTRGHIITTDDDGNMNRFDVSKLTTAISNLKTELEGKIAGLERTKAAKDHNHDARYYTKTESDGRYIKHKDKIAFGRANTSEAVQCGGDCRAAIDLWQTGTNWDKTTGWHMTKTRYDHASKSNIRIFRVR